MLIRSTWEPHRGLAVTAPWSRRSWWLGGKRKPNKLAFNGRQQMPNRRAVRQSAAPQFCGDSAHPTGAARAVHRPWLRPPKLLKASDAIEAG
jgi:hypothetical protein